MQVILVETAMEIVLLVSMGQQVSATHAKQDDIYQEQPLIVALWVAT
jgi:lysophospholipid acyltransferase (LPLAT)-like uncharacterized protein